MTVAGTKNTPLSNTGFGIETPTIYGLNHMLFLVQDVFNKSIPFMRNLLH